MSKVMPGPASLIRCRFRWLCLVALAALGAVASCSQPPPDARQTNRHSFTDGTGRQVAIIANPQRIISLAPNITEILFALGCGDRIVGVTTYCDFPPEARAKEKIGDTLRPNLERIIALKPDLVLISTASQLELLTRRLDELSIPVYVTNPRTVSEVVASIRHLGEVTGATRRASELADEMDRRIQAVRQSVKDAPRPRVFYVLQTGPLITAGCNTFINDLINLAGGESISADETADYPQYSRETVVARAPEVIVAPESHGNELVSEETLRRDFATTPAARHHRIVRVNPDLTNRPGPRIVEGLEQLARALHSAGSRR